MATNASTRTQVARKARIETELHLIMVHYYRCEYDRVGRG
jgi:hypothetical protein